MKNSAIISIPPDSITLAITTLQFEHVETKELVEQKRIFEKLLLFNLVSFGEEYESFSLLEVDIEKGKKSEQKAFPKLQRTFVDTFFNGHFKEGHFLNNTSRFKLSKTGKDHFLQIIYGCKEGLLGNLYAISHAAYFLNSYGDQRYTVKNFIKDFGKKIKILKSAKDEGFKDAINRLKDQQEVVRSILEGDEAEAKPLLKVLQSKLNYYFPRLYPFIEKRGVKISDGASYKDTYQAGILTAYKYHKIFDIDYSMKVFLSLNDLFELQENAKEQQYLAIEKHLGMLEKIFSKKGSI